MLVPEQASKVRGLVGAGCLEGVSLLHCDLSFLLGNSRLPHGAWKKVKVSNTAGKGSGKQTRNAYKILVEKIPCPLPCRKILRPGDSQVESCFGNKLGALSPAWILSRVVLLLSAPAPTAQRTREHSVMPDLCHQHLTSRLKGLQRYDKEIHPASLSLSSLKASSSLSQYTAELNVKKQEAWLCWQLEENWTSWQTGAPY